MSMKRTRATYESDLKAKQSPYVIYGTPLPPLDPNVRDDGSYVPEWKQEVRDERGRKRLHGAFTGGFSAGYFNTVGSKEGWTPSTFVSSRSNRAKDETKPVEQRPEDFMDWEDMADAAEHERVQTAASFAGLGSTEVELAQRGAFIDLFKTADETMGVKLLRKMGWREGQGLGPRVKRIARLGDDITSTADGEQHLFAPENTKLVSFVRKNDHKGLGYSGAAKLTSEVSSPGAHKSEDEDIPFGTAQALFTSKKKKAPTRGGIGIGVLNDTGSDSEDPYEIGPRISYNKTIGGEKKKKKNVVANGAVKPAFISKKVREARASLGLRKCHDGRLPLDGFILGSSSDANIAQDTAAQKYKPPEVPKGWKSSKILASRSGSNGYVSTADAARTSTMGPKARAELLGETPLPGKSVFDFLSASARDRIAALSGKKNLPAGLGEVPEGYALTPEEKQKELLSQIPKLAVNTAAAALARGASGWMPYADDKDKQSRYRSYLEIQAGIRNGIPARPPNMLKIDWLKELNEFKDCAQIFKPMSEMMATRFTSSTSSQPTNSPLLTKCEAKSEDPAEVAAKMGMFGRMTRSEADFFPTKLVCKRFGIPPPLNVQPDDEDSQSTPAGPEQPVSKSDIDDLINEASRRAKNQAEAGASEGPTARAVAVKDFVVNVEHNEALEAKKASEAVFQSIFGEDSDED